MKNLKFIVLALAMAAFMGTGLAWSPTAQATALSNDAITVTEFCDFTGDCGNLVAELYSTFDYALATTGGDGGVWSAVFTGIGDAAGLNVYLYAIEHFDWSSEVKVSGISFDFMTNPFLTPVGEGDMTSFYLSDIGGIATGSADWYLGSISFGGSVPWLVPGQYSYFGTFSPLPPGTVTADVLDGGATLASADVLTPVPEPASMMLLGSGLVGIAAFARRKWLARR